MMMGSVPEPPRIAGRSLHGWGVALSEAMEFCEVYRSDGVMIGLMDRYGCVFTKDVNGALLFKVREGKVYSLHDQFLGRFLDGVAKTDHGEVIFTVF